MSDRSSIEWTDASWNPIRAKNLATGRIGWHCEHKSDGCRNCYAESFNARLGTQLAYKPGHRGDIEIYLDERMLLLPLKWRKPRKVFVCSMTDLFADFVSDEWIDRMFAVMALCPQHTFQVLTKRPERTRDYLLADRRDEINSHAGTMMHFDDMPSAEWPLPNVWLGVSVEDQATADERIPILLDTPAAIRWLSCEPLLGPVSLTNVCFGYSWIAPEVPGPVHHFDVLKGLRQNVEGEPWRRIDWVVVGGESGSKARDNGFIDSARSILGQCRSAEVPFFGKQNVRKAELPADLQLREWPKVAA